MCAKRTSDSVPMSFGLMTPNNISNSYRSAPDNPKTRIETFIESLPPEAQQALRKLADADAATRDRILSQLDPQTAATTNMLLENL